MEGLHLLLVDASVAGKLSISLNEPNDETAADLRDWNAYTHLLSSASERATEELAESRDQNHAGSTIHHAGWLMDIIYEMMDATVYSIPHQESFTEELLDDAHPHKAILRDQPE